MKAEVSTNTVHLHDSIVEVVMGEQQGAESILELRQHIDTASQGKALDVLVDVSPVTGGDGSGRPVVLDQFFKDLPFRRMAVFGARTSSASLAIKEILEELAQPDRLKLFHREEDARAWLQTKL
ncbi:MAG TPA: STAS/SEC14 domain-containing protein [Verrucomicrobiae bacterium]|nr:STAS/SEC14 domain-containing protein [Verrucomicrobiae bacterium]